MMKKVIRNANSMKKVKVRQTVKQSVSSMSLEILNEMMRMTAKETHSVKRSVN